MPNPDVLVLLEMVDQAFDHRAWHGTNLKRSIRGVSAKQAAWRPGRSHKESRHNIWELVVHAAYWKYVARRKILGEKPGTFALKGSNWFVRPAPGAANEKAWKQDVALLIATHASLYQTIAKLTSSDLKKRPRGSRVDVRGLVVGIAAHDLYHTGQIQLIKRLMEKS